MKLNPIHDRVLVRRVEADKVSTGGIILLDEHTPDQGEVVAAGPGRVRGETLVPCSVQTGDRVLFARGRHQTTEVDGEELIVLRDEDLLAVVEP